MLLIYTPKITSRITYIFRQFFTRILLMDIEFTTKVDDFVAHSGSKITYAKQPLGSEFFVERHDILLQQGENDIDIEVSAWDNTKCFFKVSEKSTVPFDVFAASFYLLSRYEEHIPHIKDAHGRFAAKESLAYKNDFLDKPIVDIWAKKVQLLLVEKFPSCTVKEKDFQFISTIDIDSAFAYKEKGIIRNFGGAINDIIQLQFRQFWTRILVLLNIKKDPFDTFEWLLKMKKRHEINMVFFFLVSEYTTYDKNISTNNSKFQSLIKEIADYAPVGLHPSYFTMRNKDKLKKEKKRLESIINTPIVKSRQHYLRVDLPKTYQNLVELEVQEDYSMGYAQHYGFRASTCTPFYFYDLEFEIQTPLKLIPFAFMDVTFKDYLQFSNRKTLATILQLVKEVKEVNGTFVSLLHNETFDESSRFKKWRLIYEKMIKGIKLLD